MFQSVGASRALRLRGCARAAQPNLAEPRPGADALQRALRSRGIDCEIRRASARETDEDELCSTGRIVERIVERRC
jgi:hypothetical protein